MAVIRQNRPPRYVLISFPLRRQNSQERTRRGISIDPALQFATDLGKAWARFRALGSPSKVTRLPLRGVYGSSCSYTGSPMGCDTACVSMRGTGGRGIPTVPYRKIEVSPEASLYSLLLAEVWCGRENTARVHRHAEKTTVQFKYTLPFHGPR